MKNAIISNKSELLVSPSVTSGSSDFDFLMGPQAERHSLSQIQPLNDATQEIATDIVL